ncbi:unnamed protein product, partial [Urochloa humidicola]
GSHRPAAREAPNPAVPRRLSFAGLAALTVVAAPTGGAVVVSVPRRRQAIAMYPKVDEGAPLWAQQAPPPPPATGFPMSGGAGGGYYQAGGATAALAVQAQAPVIMAA